MDIYHISPSLSMKLFVNKIVTIKMNAYQSLKQRYRLPILKVLPNILNVLCSKGLNNTNNILSKASLTDWYFLFLYWSIFIWERFFIISVLYSFMTYSIMSIYNFLSFVDCSNVCLLTSFSVFVLLCLSLTFLPSIYPLTVSCCLFFSEFDYKSSFFFFSFSLTVFYLCENCIAYNAVQEDWHYIAFQYSFEGPNRMDKKVSS